MVPASGSQAKQAQQLRLPFSTCQTNGDRRRQLGRKGQWRHPPGEAGFGVGKKVQRGEQREAVQPIMTSSQRVLPASSLHPGVPEQMQWSPWLVNYSVSREGPQVLSLGTARAENSMLELMAPSPLKPTNGSGG